MPTQQERKNWLILSHGFNMDGRAASLTVTDKVPYLLEKGINLTVLSAVTGKKDNRFLHYQLLPWGPSGLRFDFRHFIATRYGRGILYKILTPLASLFLLPFTAIERLVFGLSSQASWAIPAAIRGAWLVKKHRIDVVYSSGGAWSAHLAGYWIKKLMGVEWIVEVHDPMVMRTKPEDDGSAPRKNREDRFFQKLERLVCQHADHVWWFTQGALEYAKLRNPALGNKGFVVFPGAEPPGCHQSLPASHPYTDQLHFAHFGSLADNRSFAPLIEVMDQFFKNNPNARDKVRIHVYGAGLDSASKEAIAKFQFQELVIAHGRIENDPSTGKSGRERITELMRSADVLLALHGNYEACAEYIPSKLYDYFWSNRPIFALTYKNTQLDEMLQTKHSYLAHTFDQYSIYASLETIWSDWQAHSLRVQNYSPITPKDAVEQILKRVNQ